MILFTLQSGGSPGMINLVLLVGLIFVMYFFFMRPQMKKQKAQTKFMNELKKGDQVVTAAGIVGKISKLNEKDISLQIDQKTFINVIPSAISKEMTEQYNK